MIPSLEPHWAQKTTINVKTGSNEYEPAVLVGKYYKSAGGRVMATSDRMRISYLGGGRIPNRGRTKEKGTC